MYEETLPKRRRFQFSLGTLFIVIVVIAAYLGGRASLQTGRHPDLSGRWLLTTASGFQHAVTLRELGDGRYLLAPSALNNSGVYLFQEGQLRLTGPNHKGKDGFVWKLLDEDRLVLVAQPPVAKTGSDYLGSTLERQPENVPAARVPPTPPRTGTAEPPTSPLPARIAEADVKPAPRPKESSAQVDADLTGAWQLTLPAGFQRAMKLKPVGDGQYRLLPSGLNFSGVYELRNGDLVIIEPARPELTGFRWHLEDDGTLLLIEQPTKSMGANYVGATLRRADDVTPAKQ